MTRSTITPAKTRDIFYQQLAEGYIIHVGDNSFRLQCPLCGKAIDRISKTINEHMTPLELGGADDPSNIRIVHKHCADRKTNGAGHVKVDGDASKIAKARRLAKAQEAHQRGEKKASRMQSRPFDKKYRKRFNGTVERRA